MRVVRSFVTLCVLHLELLDILSIEQEYELTISIFISFNIAKPKSAQRTLLEGPLHPLCLLPVQAQPRH